MFVCGECGWAQPTPGRCNDGTQLAPIGDDLLLGTNLGPYRIARLLGVGGMGRVYKGVHPQIGSRVAIKVLSRECTDRPDLVERFFAEARAVNLVNHEGIVNVLDLSVLPDGRPFIIMEFLDGAPLSAIIEQAKHRGTPLPVGSVARVAVEVLDALAAAHGKGIVHRDLKPDNIYITPGGRPKVLDFGIAKLQPELGGNSATHTGSLLGTPQYMAPEQASGRVVDARADLYALGCILYECLTLQRPFVADSLFDLLRKHIEEPVRPPRELRADLPEGVEHVLLIALAKQPEARFSTAAAMSQALQHATAQLPPEQWAPITPTGSTAPVRSNPSWGARHAPAPAPPPTPHRTPLGQASTVHVAPARASKAWLAVTIAIVVVGGGITAAILVTRGGPDAPPPVVAQPAPAETPRGTHHGKPKPKAEAAADTDTDTDDADADDPEVDVDREIAQMTHKMLQQADQQLTAAMAVPAGKAPPAVPSADLHTADGWIVRHALAPPAGYDPANLDVAAFLAFALAEAKQAIPDAELVRFDIDNVDATGHADLTQMTHMGMPGNIDVRFVSPSHLPLKPKDPKPFGFEWKCEFRVIAEPDSLEIRGIDMPCTMDAPVRPPRCPVTEIWKRAAAKIPVGKRLALDYRTMGADIPSWNTSIYGLLDERYPDDCKPR